MMQKETLYRIINHAAKAPSGHNTQPWSFEINQDAILIKPDRQRSLNIVDSDDHALYISLGCALENLIIAAKQYYMACYPEIVNTKDYTFIEVRIYPDDQSEQTELFAYINQRQVTRTKYSKKTIDQQVLAHLKDVFDGDAVRAIFYTSQADIEKMMPYIIEGSNRQFENKAFVNELSYWMRFTEKQAVRYGDGLWAAALGIPAMPEFFGRFFMKNVLTPKSEASRWKKLIKHSAGLVMLMAKDNDPEHWIELGRQFQRFGLTLTKYNIKHAHVNMPCEETDVRQKLMHDMKLNGYSPLLLLRIGYGEPLPYSFRRKLSEIIDINKNI